MVWEEPPTRHLGLDLGATNLKWAVVERAGGSWRTVEVGQVPTRAAEGPPGIVPQIADLAGSLAGSLGPVVSIGIGVPGLYLPDEGVTTFIPNIPGDWVGASVAPPVAEATGLPTSLVNDARAFGLAELRLGAARGARSAAGFTLGTGVGGFIAVDGQVVQGYRGQAGELGHLTIDPDGPLCACGSRGCLEGYARADVIARLCGTATAEEAVAAARRGDERARAGLVEVGRYLGIATATLITLLTPDRVVLGGGVAGAGELLLAPVRAEVLRRVHATDPERTAIVFAELGTTAGAIGAAVHGAERAAAVADGVHRAADATAGPAGTAPGAAGPGAASAGPAGAPGPTRATPPGSAADRAARAGTSNVTSRW